MTGKGASARHAERRRERLAATSAVYALHGGQAARDFVTSMGWTVRCPACHGALSVTPLRRLLEGCCEVCMGRGQLHPELVPEVTTITEKGGDVFSVEIRLPRPFYRVKPR